MTESDDTQRPVSVAELLARNGGGDAKISGHRRRMRGNADAIPVAELTGEIPVIRDRKGGRARPNPAPAPTPAAEPTRAPEVTDRPYLQSTAPALFGGDSMADEAVRADHRGQNRTSGVAESPIRSIFPPTPAPQTRPGEPRKSIDFNDATGVIAPVPGSEAPSSALSKAPAQAPKEEPEAASPEPQERSSASTEAREEREYPAEYTHGHAENYQDELDDQLELDEQDEQDELEEQHEQVEQYEQDEEVEQYELDELDEYEYEYGVQVADTDDDLEEEFGDDFGLEHELAELAGEQGDEHDLTAAKSAIGIGKNARTSAQKKVDKKDKTAGKKARWGRKRDEKSAPADLDRLSVQETAASGDPIAEVSRTVKLKRYARIAWITSQYLFAAAAGAALFLGFRELWSWNQGIALGIGVLFIAILVASLWVVRKTVDLISILIAIVVGSLIAFGPLVLMLQTVD